MNNACLTTFAVFRELVQNADDAGAEKVEIEFQTNDYIPATSVEDWNIIQVCLIEQNHYSRTHHISSCPNG